MTKNILKISRVSRGSALLITLLLMGALMTITLGISTLVLREIHVTQSVVDANKAYYSAEAGVERALLGLSRNGAGFEPKGEFPVDEASADPLDTTFKYSYTTSNTNDSVPGFGQAGFAADGKPVYVETGIVGGGSTPDCIISSGKNPFALAISKERLYKECARATYRKLALNETAIIPLFSVDGGGTPVKVEDFIVQYYLNVHDGSGLWGEFKGLDLQKFDVLRWKLYGKPVGFVGAQRTESIADFYPGVNGNDANNPVCIGTDSGITSTVSDAPEKCILPVLSIDTPGSTPQTLWSAARECYLSDAGSLVTGGAQIKKTSTSSGAGCEMRDFITSHDENYLVLTNMVNPDIVGISNVKDPSQLTRADIYYRILAKRDAGGLTEPKLVKDYAEINSTGFAKNDAVAKTLSVKYKAPGFLPVFNFSLYKTTGKSDDSTAFTPLPTE